MFGLLMLVSTLAAGQPPDRTAADAAFSAHLESAAPKLPQCLSRFLDYPPGPGKLGFPRCLFESPFAPNPDFWLKDVDFSCVSPWNDSCGALRAGTAISRRHIVFAKHFPLWGGVRIAFVGERGDVSHYTVKATKALGECDIMVGLLDYELTPDVRPAKILPEGFEQWLPLGTKWPLVTFNQREQAYLSELSCASNRFKGGISLHNAKPKSAEWRPFGDVIVGGDSGNPAFMLYRGSPILLFCLQRGGVGWGPEIHAHRKEVQRLMDDLCPGYRLETFDFSR